MSWVPFNELFTQVGTVVDAREADQTKPTFSKIFDLMIASCCVAGPEETLDETSGDYASVGHVVVYEKTSESPSECDGWIITTLQNDGGFIASRMGDPTTTCHFSHDEPSWPAYVWDFLERTWWRVLNPEVLAATA